MNQALQIAIYKIIFHIGYLWFQLAKTTPKYSYIAMRKLYYLTGGTFNAKQSECIANSSNSKINFNDSLFTKVFDIEENEINTALSEIKENGFYIFKNLLSNDVIKKLKDFALETPARLMPFEKEQFEKYNYQNPLAIKYQFSEKDLISNETIQQITLDKNLLKIAQDFLKTPPIIDLTTMWWSTSINKEANSKIAQMYHYDMDRLKFIKFFIYLTDVTPETGPHCYVKSSNGHLPKEIKTDGRYSDELIESIYGKENLLELCGKQGTLMAVDTSGIHKGKVLEHSDRLIFQIEFTNSLFGHNNDSIKGINYTPSFIEASKKHPSIYSRYI